MTKEEAGSTLDQANFKKQLLELIPFARAFARSLTGSTESGDDLAQDALAKAWESRNTFIPGTNLKAWVFTILRNQFYSDRRRAWRVAPWDQEAAERLTGTAKEQEWSSELSDTARALWHLSPEQREALILVGAGGFSYDDAARICNCATGTVKSRVARARRALIAILEGQDKLPKRVDDSSEDAAQKILEEIERLTAPKSDP